MPDTQTAETKPKRARGSKASTASQPLSAAPAKTYLLRTCNADLTSYGGFQWPETGPVTCPDWSPRAECGNGGLVPGKAYRIRDGKFVEAA